MDSKLVQALVDPFSRRGAGGDRWLCRSNIRRHPQYRLAITDDKHSLASGVVLDAPPGSASPQLRQTRTRVCSLGSGRDR